MPRPLSLSRSCDHLPAPAPPSAPPPAQSRMSDIVNDKEWRKRHRIRRLRDNKGFVWSRWVPEEVAHQRAPKPHLLRLGGHTPSPPSDNEAATPANLSSASASVSSLASSEDIAEAAEGSEPRAADTAAAERGPRVSASSAVTTNGSVAASERGHL